MTLSIEENFFTDTDTFGSENGLAIAATFYSAQGIPVEIEKGELVFYSVSWSTSDYKETKIPSHRCTDEEFGFKKT